MKHNTKDIEKLEKKNFTISNMIEKLKRKSSLGPKVTSIAILIDILTSLVPTILKKNEEFENPG